MADMNDCHPVKNKQNAVNPGYKQKKQFLFFILDV